MADLNELSNLWMLSADTGYFGYPSLVLPVNTCVDPVANLAILQTNANTTL